MKLKDLELPADAIRYRDDLGEDDDEILADALEIGLDREADTEDGPAPLRVRLSDDRACMRSDKPGTLQKVLVENIRLKFRTTKNERDFQ